MKRTYKNRKLCRKIKNPLTDLCDRKVLDGNDFQPYKIEKIVMDDGNEIILSGLVTNQSISMSSVTMLSPYQVNGHVTELIVDATDLLERMYHQYKLLLSKDSEIRSVYSTFTELLSKTSISGYRKRRVLADTFSLL